MKKHVDKEHEGKPDDVKFEWKVLRRNRKPLLRQITEAVKIAKKNTTENLNSKNEFNHHSIDRVVAKKLDCNYCGRVFNSNIDLVDHKKLFNEKFNCDVCMNVSFRSYAQRLHMKDNH